MNLPTISDQQQAQNLAAINRRFDQLGIGPHLPRLGVVGEGEYQFTRIVREFVAGYVTLLEFECLDPETQQVGTFVDLFNNNSVNCNGVCFLVTVNGKVLAERVWRPTTGRHVVGALRGFAPEADFGAVDRAIRELRLTGLPLALDDLKVAATLTELGEVGLVAHVGSLWDNPGIGGGYVHVFMTEVDNVDEDALMARLRPMAKKSAKYLLWEPGRFYDELTFPKRDKRTGKPIPTVDAITGTALFLASQRSRRNPFMK